MAELHETLLIDVAAVGQQALFSDLDGFTKGTLHVRMRSGVYGGAVIGVKRANNPATLAVFPDNSGNPLVIGSVGIPQDLDLSTRYIAVETISAGGPGIAEVILRAFVGTTTEVNITGAQVSAAAFSIGEVFAGVVNGVNDTFTSAFSMVANTEEIVVGVPMLRGAQYTVFNPTTIIFTAGNIPQVGQTVVGSYVKV